MGNTRGVRGWRLTALAAIAWGLFTITVLHIISSHDPIYDTLSSYTITDRGEGMLGASVLSVAVGSLAVLGALIAGGVPMTFSTKALLMLWAVGLAVAAVFPASYPQSPNPLSGDIHLYSCLIAFASLPGAAITMLEPLRGTAERVFVVRWLKFGLATVGLFALSFLFVRLDEAGVQPFHALTEVLPVGATQRLTLIANVALLLVLLRIAVRTETARAAVLVTSAPRP
ncbi:MULTISPECIES: DUF998 domain-containing protein [unclassified Amycolatopsis]|uniref:DUF998 domain-containing protein n=1 Tax=unclassified Amycolatopsis TaxID=2618356 RepID=UPI001EE807F5|nr:MULTISPECIES: DUF998 domain-containing protein [unclassified Amycolatopsis]MCG3749065.1 DUF998 domain-containing protein [Amycolatopsis sp. Poz14]